MRHLLIFAAIGLLCATGCVGKGKYNALKTDLEGQVESRDAKVSSLAASLEAEKNRADDLHAKLQAKELELADMVKDHAKLSASAEQLQRAMSELAARKAESERRVAQFRNLLEKFKTMIDAGKLRVKMANGRMVMVLPTDVLFASGKARLSPEGAAAIGEVASILATLSNRKFQVEGHTDNVPITTKRFPSNWELASARATTVVTTMTDAGMDPSVLSAASFGAHRPFSDNETEEGRTANRRIEIVLVPDLSQLPGFQELTGAIRAK